MQYDFGTIDPTITSGAALASEIQSHRDAVISSHSGAGRPSYAVPGTLWVGTAGSVWTLYLYTGTVDAAIGAIDPTTGVLVSADGGNFNTLSNKPATFAAWATAMLAPAWFSKNDPSPPGKIDYFAMSTPPAGYLKANGAAVDRTTYADLDTNIWCGSTLNASALFGYRTTSTSAPSTNRSTTGSFIVLPDLRGEFMRGWDDSRGADASRVFGTAQAQMFQDHTHTAASVAAGSHAHNVLGGIVLNVALSTGGTPIFQFAGTAPILGTDAQGNHAHTISVGAASSGTPGAETRPRNLAMLACIRY